MISMTDIKIQSIYVEVVKSAFTVVVLLLAWKLLLDFWKNCFGISSGKSFPPGPKGLPLVGYVPFLGSRPHETLLKLSEIYGNIIGLRLGLRSAVVLNEYSDARDVFMQAASLDRSPGLFDFPPMGFISASGKEWVEQRRFCMAAMRQLSSDNELWETKLQDEVSRFSSVLREANGKPIECYSLLKGSLIRNIISLLVGRQIRKGEDDTVNLSLDFLVSTLKILQPTNPACLYPKLRKICEICRIGPTWSSLPAIRRFTSFLYEEVFSHKNYKDSHSSEDFINIYLEEIEKHKKLEKKNHFFSESMLVQNIILMYLASNDTLFSSITYLLRLMAKHKEAQVRVRKELEENVGKNVRARYADRDKIPYTMAVLMETERLTSALPLCLPRRANQDIKVKNYVIPKGSDIIVNLWALHHDPRYWDEPHAFRPERFLEDGGRKIIKNIPSYAPFSIGRRDCPGSTIAWVELVAYFTEIVRNFDIGTEPGVEPDFSDTAMLVKTLVPQPMCFKAI